MILHQLKRQQPSPESRPSPESDNNNNHHHFLVRQVVIPVFGPLTDQVHSPYCFVLNLNCTQRWLKPRQKVQCKVFCICLNCNLSANSFCVSDWLSSVFKHVRLLDWLVWFCCLVVICKLSKVSYRAFSEFE